MSNLVEKYCAMLQNIVLNNDEKAIQQQYNNIILFEQLEKCNVVQLHQYLKQMLHNYTNISNACDRVQETVNAQISEELPNIFSSIERMLEVSITDNNYKTRFVTIEDVKLFYNPESIRIENVQQVCTIKYNKFFTMSYLNNKFVYYNNYINIYSNDTPIKRFSINECDSFTIDKFTINVTNLSTVIYKGEQEILKCTIGENSPMFTVLGQIKFLDLNRLYYKDYIIKALTTGIKVSSKINNNNKISMKYLPKVVNPTTELCLSYTNNVKIKIVKKLTANKIFVTIPDVQCNYNFDILKNNTIEDWNNKITFCSFNELISEFFINYEKYLF